MVYDFTETSPTLHSQHGEPGYAIYKDGPFAAVIVGSKIGATFVLSWSAPRMPHGGKAIVGYVRKYNNLE